MSSVPDTLAGDQAPLEFAPQWRRSPLDRFAWDNLRLLLAVAEAGSLRSASVRAGVALNTLRTKVDRLEMQFGAPLLVRNVEGVRLTQEGHELVAIARQMQTLGKTARRVHRPIEGRQADCVRITITEGLGTFWIVPLLVHFRTENPDLTVDLHCEMAPADVLFRDTDIAIQLARPSSPGLMIEQVGCAHVMPFASDEYLARRGTPVSLADAADHELVWQDAEQIATDALGAYIANESDRPRIVLRTNTSSAHYWAVVRGAGIGFLPTYARALGRSPRPLDIGVRLRREIHVAHHPRAARDRQVGRTLDWLRSVFDGKRFPWFADRFVHPDEFAERLTPDDAALFDGFR